MYQEDYRTSANLDLSDEETPAKQQEQPTTQLETPEASQAPPFVLAHLDALEQCLNHRVDSRLQALNDSVDSGLMNLYDRVAADIQMTRPREILIRLSSYFRLSLTLRLPTNLSITPYGNRLHERLSYKSEKRDLETLTFIFFSPLSLLAATPHGFRPFPPLNLKNTSKPLPLAS
ncbi:hypothetical protein Lal_00033794 [Lupinus albus]|nr:hypothetical protein Lal_00033794 [Lupinus albus]